MHLADMGALSKQLLRVIPTASLVLAACFFDQSKHPQGRGNALLRQGTNAIG